MCRHKAESHCCARETSTTLSSNYAPINKLKKKKMSWDPAAAEKSYQSCPTMCDPIDSSLPGSAVPEILQTRTLEWVAISFPTWDAELNPITMKTKTKHTSETCCRHSFCIDDGIFALQWVMFKGFPGGTNGKESTCQCRRQKRCGFDPWVGKIL